MHRSALHLALASTTLLASCSYFESDEADVPTTATTPAAGTGGATASTTNAPTRTSGDVASLVPVDAVAYAEVSSLGEVDAMLREVGRMADEPMLSAMLNADMLIQMLTGGAGKAELLDRSKPIGIAVTMSAEFEPEPTFLLPCLDAEGFARSMGSLPGGPSTEVEGDYVVVTQSKGYRTGSGPHPLAVGVPEGQLAVRIDFTKISDQLGPMVGMGLAQAQGMAQAQGAGAGEMALVGRLEDGAGTFLESAETLDLGYSLEGGELNVSVAFTAKEGSPLAEYGSTGTTHMPKLARYLDAGEVFAFCAGTDTAFFQDRIEPLLEEALRSQPDGQEVAEFLPFFSNVRRMLGTTFAVGGNFADEGAHLAWYCKPRDEQAFITWLEGTFASLTDGAPYMAVSSPSRSTSGDIALTEWVFEVPDATGEMRPARVARQRAEMAQIFGTEEVHVRIASNGEHMALVVGGDEEYFQGAIDKLSGQAGTMDADLERAVSWVGSANPSFVATFDLAQVAAQVEGLTQRLTEVQLGEGALAAAGIAAASLPEESVDVTYYGAIENRTWRFGLLMDLEGMLQFAKAASTSF